VIVHALSILIVGPLASVLKVGSEVPFCWRSILQYFSGLVEVDLGIAGWHLNYAQVLEVVEHRVVVDIAIGVFTLDPPYEIAVQEVAMENGLTVLAHSVNGEGRAGGGGPLHQEGVYFYVMYPAPSAGVCLKGGSIRS
jgi:hypothetical protein